MEVDMRKLLPYLLIAGLLVVIEFVLIFFAGLNALVPGLGYFILLFMAAVGALFILGIIARAGVFPHPMVDEVIFGVGYAGIAHVALSQPSDFALPLGLVRFFMAFLLALVIPRILKK